MSSTLRGSLSTVPQGQIIDFERAELRRLPFQDSLYLWVKGRLPPLAMMRDLRRVFIMMGDQNIGPSTLRLLLGHLLPMTAVMRRIC